MKLIERLRAMRGKAMEKLEALQKLGTGDKPRDLTTSETAEFAALTAEVTELDACIASEELKPAAVPAPAAPAPAVPAVAGLAATVQDPAVLRAEGAAVERKRIDGIKGAIAVALRICASLPATLEKELIDGGVQLEAARAQIMEKVQALQTENPTVSQHQVTRDQRDTFKARMEAAILLRFEPKADAVRVELGRQFRGLNLLEMAREYLRSAGVKTEGMDRDTVARVALQGNLGTSEYFMGGLHSTSDFPNILANVANKTLRQGYEAAGRTFPAFARQVTASDFKPIARMQLSDIAALRKVNEHGEFKRRTITDAKQTYSLETYGDIIGITRKVIINDDLDALTRIPRGFGQAAATMESDVVWAIITGNQTMMEDNVALFHASHSNLNLTNDFDEDGLAVMRKGLRLQRAPQGTLLNLAAKYILIPAALEMDVDQVISSTGLMMPTAATGVIPGWIRQLIPIVEPRLDAVSPTTWYGAADPALIDTIEYCYLEGQDGVFIETRQGFDVDGVEIKCREDFAAAAIDYRGLVKNTA